jgi:inositol hexakisphosphate/diphosphoinositol-pentakisphosphate kinase
VYDRWRKLAKAFWNEKKGYDISKVPDIYDAAKFDSIHNAGLQLEGLQQLYNMAKILANAVIPNEYGLQALMKLRIGSTICANLLGKLLSDLASMRDESMSTAGMQHKDSASRSEFAAGLADAMEAISEDVSQSDESELHGGEDDAGDDDSTMHRLCPTYAQDVNSPLRHVRTRIYFTSESHCHALTNVLRYCHVGLPDNRQGLLGDAAEGFLHNTLELDYMTHVVLRMFENKTLPLRDESRFRVEILFSPGAAHSPYDVVPIRKDHVIPIVPRMPISLVSLNELEKATKPFAKPFKRDQDPYVSGLKRGTLSTTVASELKHDFWI